MGEEEVIVSRNTLQSHTVRYSSLQSNRILTQTLVRVRPRIMREKGGRGKKMGESGERELRKTPEGKLRRKEYEKRGMEEKG